MALANATEGAARSTVLKVTQGEPSHGSVAWQSLVDGYAPKSSNDPAMSLHPMRATPRTLRRDGNAQAEELVSSQGMIRQDDGTQAGSDSTEWPDAPEESHAALPEVMTPVAWEFLSKLRIESGRNAGC